MNLMKNEELRRELIIYIAGTFIFAAALAFISLSAGLVMIFAGAFYISVFLMSVRTRYRAMADLSNSIDRILHGDEQMLITENREGELSILRSQIQKMIIRLREQADSLQKDKVRLSDAIADISHQLRTPLTSMNLTVSMLSREDAEREKRLRMTHDLKKSLARIDWLIEALLKISKIDAGTAQFILEPVPVKELIRKAADPIIVPMELKGQSLHVSADVESYTGDIYWSVEALGNILKNCMEHTPDGGNIYIEARETAIFTEISVRDDGEGFSEGDIPHLFERFYTGKNSSSDSVGIGLALARMIVVRQNGTVTAGNSRDGGAEFIIRFYKGVV